MIPLLKWPGGKRWFVFRHRALLPSTYGRYIEPFFGGGSVFFHLEPAQAILGDTNEELIDVYRAIKQNHRRVETLLRKHHLRHSSQNYYKARETIPDDLIERAARTIYLNRTCFNGIYRVNLAGVFNVPIGTKTSVILDTDDFAATARLLKTAEFHVSDFQPLIDGARRDDLVFADPPYTIAHNNNGFLKYNETLFKWDDQIRLADTLAQARDRGVKIVATNADHLSVRELYIQRATGL